MSRILPFVCVSALCIALVVAQEDLSNVKGLKSLDDASFDEYVKDNAAVIALFHGGDNSDAMKKPFSRAAQTRGTSKAYKAVFAEIDCDKSTKLCAKYAPNSIKLFLEGKFAADYVRDVSSIALLKFAKDPTVAGAGEGVNEFFDENSNVNVLTSKTFPSFISKHEKDGGAFVMFYAPWCGHCKNAKPELIQAAQKWSAGGIAAVDCDVHRGLCNKHKVKGFPTFLYFKDGAEGKNFGGDRTAKGFLDFLQDPNAEPPKPEQAPFLDDEADEEDQKAVPLLGDDTFNDYVKANKAVLVMFYAPWCGHCKSAKPDFAAAAKTVNAGGTNRLAAVDCTVHAKTCSDHGVSGYPTIKFFKDGKAAKEYEGGRTKTDFINFFSASDAKPAAKPFLDDGSDASAVEILSSKEQFAEFTQEHNKVLVMFYAPWCGHCKHAKPDYAKAAKELLGGSDGVLAAVDCTSSSSVCSQFDVKGYPTIKLFVNGKFAEDYKSGRDKDSFVKFMKASKKGGHTGGHVHGLEPDDEL